MGGQGNPRERNRERREREGGMGEGRERRLGGNRFFLLWRHPPDPDVVCADSAAGDWEVTGDFKNMSIFATIDKLYPPNDWLVGSSLPSKFSQTIIESALNELTPNNVRTWRKTVDRASKVFSEMHYNRHKRLTNDIA
ncbi:unnamed protein product [Camellia sinensis]